MTNNAFYAAQVMAKMKTENAWNVMIIIAQVVTKTIKLATIVKIILVLFLIKAMKTSENVKDAKISTVLYAVEIMRFVIHVKKTLD